MRGERFFTAKVPNPAMDTGSPFFKLFVMEFKITLIALVAPAFDKPDWSAICSTSSDLFMITLSRSCS